MRLLHPGDVDLRSPPRRRRPGRSPCRTAPWRSLRPRRKSSHSPSVVSDAHPPMASWATSGACRGRMPISPGHRRDDDHLHVALEDRPAGRPAPGAGSGLVARRPRLTSPRRRLRPARRPARRSSAAAARRPRRGHHVVDAALHTEGLLGQVVVLALDDLLEAAHRLLQRHELARDAGELLGHEERLRQELLDLAGPAHGHLVLVGELVHAQDGDDVAQVLVALQDLLHLGGRLRSARRPPPARLSARLVESSGSTAG